MIIQLKNINKAFGNKTIFEGFNLTVESGEMVAITGESGKGKTTLLNMIGIIDRPDSGEIVISNFTNPKGAAATKLRRNTIGYLFQNFALIEDSTVFQNLNMALAYSKIKLRKQAILDAISYVSLPADVLNQKIYNLSGGEQQRIAIARLLLKPSSIILADEPTGSLDENNKNAIIELLKKMNEDGKTVIIVTHDNDVAAACSRTCEL